VLLPFMPMFLPNDMSNARYKIKEFAKKVETTNKLVFQQVFELG